MRKSRSSHLLAEANEEQYLHVGVDHLTAVGDASASLGLISTLVLGISVSAIMEMDRTVHAWKDLFLALAVSFSTYTTTYSLLEYYYVQTLKSVDSFMANRVVDAPPEDSLLREAEEEGGTLLPGATTPVHRSKRGSQGVREDRAVLMQRVEDGFASFNNMRMWARNSMWLSLMCILGATIVKIDPALGHADDHSSSMKTATFSALMLTSLICALSAGFTSTDVKAYTATSAVGMVGSVAANYYLDRGLPTAKICSSLFLLMGIIVVPLTVKNFRGTYLTMAKAHTRIH